MSQSESDARRQLIRTYDALIDDLTRQIDDAVDLIERYPDAKWRTMHLSRLRQLLDVAEARYTAFTRDGASTVDAARIHAARQGAADAVQLTTTATTSSSIGTGTINGAALERVIGAMGAGSPLEDTLDGYGTEGRKLIEKKMKEAIAQGRGARKVARELRGELGSGVNRARLEALTRTESMRAYRTAAKEQYKEKAHLLDGLRWRAGKSTRTCLACLAMDGTVYPVDDAPDHFHVQCRCVYTPIPKGSTRPYTDGDAWLRQSDAVKPGTVRGMFPSKDAYEAWQRGDVELRDFVGVRRSRKWGDSVFVRSGRAVVPPAGSTRKPAPKVMKPIGNPVSRSLDIPNGKLKPIMDDALAAIDKVHGVGALPRIPVKYTSGDKTLGSYTRDITGKPRDIHVSRKSDTPGLTLIHETGHFLDNQAMSINPRRNRTSVIPGSDPEGLLDPWRAAVRKSRLAGEMEDAAKTGRIKYKNDDGTVTEYRVQSQFMRYATSSDELWARSYAQYIATRSGNPALLAELDTTRKPGTFSFQWDDDDFAPIADVMDDIFRALGWAE